MGGWGGGGGRWGEVGGINRASRNRERFGKKGALLGIQWEHLDKDTY